MGILIDIVLILVLLVSTFAGYKKGLVAVATRLFAGVISIIVMLLICRPVANFVINNTQIDEKIEGVIIENSGNMLDENINSSNEQVQGVMNTVTDEIKNKAIVTQAENVTINIIYIMSSIIVYVILKVLLIIIIKITNVIMKLPILKQFNEIGGIIYGFLRGGVIVIIAILLLNVYIKINVENSLEDKIEQTYITKIIYNKVTIHGSILK